MKSREKCCWAAVPCGKCPRKRAAAERAGAEQGLESASTTRRMAVRACKQEQVQAASRVGLSAPVSSAGGAGW
jgi:hypothetical protein